MANAEPAVASTRSARPPPHSRARGPARRRGCRRTDRASSAGTDRPTGTPPGGAGRDLARCLAEPRRGQRSVDQRDAADPVEGSGERIGDGLLVGRKARAGGRRRGHGAREAQPDIEIRMGRIIAQAGPEAGRQVRVHGAAERAADAACRGQDRVSLGYGGAGAVDRAHARAAERRRPGDSGERGGARVDADQVGRA